MRTTARRVDSRGLPTLSSALARPLRSRRPCHAHENNYQVSILNLLTVSSCNTCRGFAATAKSSTVDKKVLDDGFFYSRPLAFWKEPNNFNRFLAYVAEKHDIEARGGQKLLQRHGSVFNIVSHAIPTSEGFYEWLFPDPLPKTFWKIKDNQYRYMRWLGGVLGREEANPSQWYTVTKDDFVRNGGGPLLALFQESHHNLLSSLYPHIEWLPWMFHTAPHGFWGEMANQRQYMKWLGQLLRREEGIPEKWYSVTSEDFIKNHGAGLLFHYDNSPFLLLKSIYSTAEWLPWCFDKAPNGYWKKEENQRQYLDWLFRKLGYKTMDDWYQVSTKDFKENHGRGLLKAFNGSPSLLVSTVYKSHHFLPFKFQRAPYGLGEDIEELRDLVKQWEAELNLKSLDDWYRVSSQNLRDIGAAFLIKREGNLVTVLRKCYPDHRWEEPLFTSKLKASRLASTEPSIT